MSLNKLGQFINERLPLIVGIGIIVSIHVGWYKLQQVPYLVPESDKKEFPLFAAFRVLKKKTTDKIESLSNSKAVSVVSTESK